MATEYLYDRYNGVYWQGALYYQVIKLPMNNEVSPYKNHFLGRSMRGVHYALIDNEHRQRVWFLNKSCGQMTWELKHDKDLSFLPGCQEICIQNDGPWTLHYKNYFGNSSQNGTEEYYEAYKEYIVRRYCYTVPRTKISAKISRKMW
uniref:F-box associated domain-containing protein n=1 Tax=Oryza glumipatula TaxID=40148 RepID=A0A0D9ZBJ3_9ORYZ